MAAPAQHGPGVEAERDPRAPHDDAQVTTSIIADLDRGTDSLQCQEEGVQEPEPALLEARRQWFGIVVRPRTFVAGRIAFEQPGDQRMAAPERRDRHLIELELPVLAQLVEFVWESGTGGLWLHRRWRRKVVP